MPGVSNRLLAATTADVPELVDWRRHLHAHPELSGAEVETTAFLRRTLEQWPQVRITQPLPTGLVAEIGPAHGGRSIAVRADIDALPIQEESGAEYASVVDGVMHACGHDAHAAIGLALLARLAPVAELLPGRLRVLFQPAEETLPGGAVAMVEAGCMDDIDAVLALHVDAGSPVGCVLVGPGPVLASVDDFAIEVEGRGGHAAAPHNTVDAVLVGAHLTQALHLLVGRVVDPLLPAVLTVGALQAGDAPNVIPARATLLGTSRCFDPGVRSLLEHGVRRVAAGIGAAHGAECRVRWTSGTAAVISNATIAAHVRDAASECAQVEKVLAPVPSLGGDDASALFAVAPGAYVQIGSRNEARGIVADHHHPAFDVDEAALPIGVELLMRSVLALLHG